MVHEIQASSCSFVVFKLFLFSVYDVTDESTVIGQLTVTVEALNALLAVNEEMNPEGPINEALSGM